jgi:predicted HTH transcriptional regulator
MSIASLNYTSSELVGLGESQTLEFKRSGSLIKESFSDLCAMINASVGTGLVIFGVEPNGVVCGLGNTNLDSLQQTLANHARQKFDPPLQILLETASCDGRSILLLRASRNRAVPYHEYDGRAYVREGSISRLLSVVEKNHFMLSRNRANHNGPWRCDKCGASAGTISCTVFTDTGPYKIYTHKCGGEWWPAT